MLTALLLAVPAAYAADVTISCAADGNEVTVSYTASADANKPRAFGLDIQLDNGETITTLTLLDPNYWVSPGTIDINASGVIVYDGNGIGQQDDAAYPDTLYGLDSNGITIEIGSLHSPPEYDSPNAPDLSSAILKFTVSGDCNVAISGNAARGNVVLYDATAADVAYGSGCTVTVPSGGCACEGDVNGDTFISVLDLSAIVSFLAPAYAGTNPPYTAPAGDAPACYDVNGDTFISVLDLSAIVAYLAPAYVGTNPPYTTQDCMP